MTIIARPNTYTAGTTILSAQVNSDFNTIYADYNGSITKDNLSATAGIVDTQLAQITTGQKVNLSALVATSQATGDIIYASSSTVMARLAAGTSSQVLNGGTTPSWAGLPVGALPTGSILQVVSTSLGTMATGTTAVPYDDTIPQITEGTQFMTRAITPASTSNKLLILANLVLTNSGAARQILAMFNTDYHSTNAVCSVVKEVANAGLEQIMTIMWYMAAPLAGATTFTFRCGTAAADTVTFNGSAGAAKMGGSMGSTVTIYEIKG